jgi:hypothetical protein
VGQLVDEGDLGPAGHNGVDVHLGEADASMEDGAPGHDRQVGDLAGGLGPAMGLDEPDDHVGAPLAPAAALVEHGEGLAHTGRGAEVDPQGAAPPVGAGGVVAGGGRGLGAHHQG